MEWTEKVEKLRRGRSLAAIERAAGWKPNTLSNALRDGTMPSADRGIRLARVLGVDPEWLFDSASEFDGLIEAVSHVPLSDAAVLPIVKLAVAEALRQAAQAIVESVGPGQSSGEGKSSRPRR